MGKYFREIQVPRFQRFPDSRGPDSRGFTVYVLTIFSTKFHAVSLTKAELKQVQTRDKAGKYLLSQVTSKLSPKLYSRGIFSEVESVTIYSLEVESVKRYSLEMASVTIYSLEVESVTEYSLEVESVTVY